MFTMVAAENFGSVGAGRVALPLAQITAFIGPNGAGKSTLMRVLLMFSRKVAHDRLPEAGSQILNVQADSGYRFYEAEADLWHNRIQSTQMRIGAQWSDCAAQQLEHARRHPTTSWEFGCVRKFDRYFVEHSLAVADRPPVVIRRMPKHREEQKSDSHSISIGKATFADFDFDPSYDRLLGTWNASIFAPRKYLVPDSESQSLQDEATARALAFATRAAGDFLQEVWGHVYFLGPRRGASLVKAGTSLARTNYVGEHGEQTLQVLSFLSGDARSADAVKEIRDWSERFGIEGVTAGLREHGELHGSYRDPSSKAFLPLGLTSYGTTQVLCIIVQLFAANDGDVIIIEEPEISLHPEAQATLAELIAYCARGKRLQVLFSTHSEHLLLSFQRAINRSKLASLDLKVIEVRKDKGATNATCLEFLKGGHVGGPLPSFDAAARDLQHDFGFENEKPRKKSK